ncbi:hypothetical protein A2356_02840 [Candidatus Nomurabacteria bacterium RIFOXYB1_FULL_39_16]|uniref:Agmatine deiminase n=1 Tax=Candidatus Nomurabacteria bacterium RIFOXYB1_FULL_39_16 TaxID=1801803 RepID=A0A1F6YRI4_9BACT|nr:MAG: hypothetical protein A2356_02840 [Candidatus Nomurabacteria bacterium RIFOXYB1_FULL_39_16]OGJ15268.1 MAG: hypothetical protein A2585_02960 [Candidatus Nomurabacteria bacterium RIFOXYD1_FULL_39_12]
MMPGEWEQHKATWLAWPNDDDFFQGKMEKVKGVYLKIILALHKDEIIKILVLNQNIEDEVRNILRNSNVDVSKIVFYQTEYVDVWIRDYGPTFIKNAGNLKWIKWNYDGYGGKFPELFPDNEVFNNLKKEVSGEKIDIDIAMEGGAIDSNGQGVVLTTEECLALNRNKDKSKIETEEILKNSLGAKRVIWLKKGIFNDHTDGHVDEVARFINPNKILLAYEENITDENYERLKENLEILEESTDQNGNKFEIIKLPMPHMKYDDDKKAPVSYANFYIGNRTVLVSLFNDENDEKAISIIKSCFPDREVVGIDCTDLIYGGGALHCITQQEPE